jgi:hypothetical protein
VRAAVSAMLRRLTQGRVSRTQNAGSPGETKFSIYDVRNPYR